MRRSGVARQPASKGLRTCAPSPVTHSEAPADGEGAAKLAGRVRTCIDRWLGAEGKLQVADDRRTLTLNDGRVAEIASHELTTTRGSICEITVTEPTAGGSFQTALAVAQEPGRVSVSCELAAGSQSLMPLWVDVHCPLNEVPWMYPRQPLARGCKGVSRIRGR
jgi:hypothetical protein